MEFVKKKSKIIAYYTITYLLISIMLPAFFILILKNHTIYISLISEAILLVFILSFLKLHIMEINQTVKVGNESIECKNYIINGRPADATISYLLIEKIEIKHIPLKPFSKCLCLSLSNDKPVIVNDDFKDYLRLWFMICNNCKSYNTNVCIDEKIFQYIKKHNYRI